MRGMPRPSISKLLDIALVVFVAAVWEWGVFESHEHVSTPIAGPRWLTVPLALVVALPLLWRRTRPLRAAALVLGGIVLQAIVSGHTPEGFQIILIWLIVPYSVAAYSSRRSALVGLAIVLAAFAVYALENDDIMSGRAGDLWAGAFFLILALGAWLAGMVMHSRREHAALAARAQALEHEAELASAEERARMARDLHDIVSHNLSAVVVQAAGARARAEREEVDPTTLEKIERSGREALVEMRRLLGVLREDNPGDPHLQPAAGLAQLPTLAERVRDAGLEVDLIVADDCADVPPAIGLSAYRIVQEALTNTLKHAGPEAHVQVTVKRAGNALSIEVVDDGGTSSGAIVPEPGGHGLVGMHERAALLGGDLVAAARPAGGFVVNARLPLAVDRT